ncbi:MAG TPA: ABC transporter permease, partial [Geminicoccaceae bacterium]|nr:ABC transporter permease [Geminicoccaceae bacterium]
MASAAPAAAAAVSPTPVRGTLAVWRRHALVWRRMMWSSLANHVANPVLMLFAFGFGLGAVIDTMEGVSYLAFVVPGMMAYSAMFSASFEATVSAFTRFHQQRSWDAVLATPVTLLELLLGEVLWAATKAMISAVAVLAVGWLWGGIPSPLGALASLPVLLLAGLVFAACGIAATSFAKSYEFFSYFFTFWVTPMFVFSGVFFEVDRFPGYVQVISWVLPMTHLIEVIRPLTVGAELAPA